jgi:hypothetical protein
MVVLEPGIYPHAFADYREIDAVNQSSLIPISTSPLHYRAALIAERVPTPPMRLGDVAHCAVLEPDKIGKRYAVWTGSSTGNMNFQGNEFKEFKAESERRGRRVIKQDELDDAMAMAAAIKRSRLAQRYMAKGVPELSLVWKDKETGLVCKARIDWLSKSIADVVVELKTAAAIGPHAFEPRFAKAQYDVQIAFYADGYRAVTGRDLHGKCVAIESAPPYDVGVYDLAEAIDTGRIYYREMLQRLSECIRTREWPGQFTEERSLQLPRWRTHPDEDVTAVDLDYDALPAESEL